MNNKSKTLQSRIKELIQTWARCIVTWKKDVNSIHVLLENLRTQQDTAVAVGRVLNNQLPAPSPLLQHPFLRSKLHSKLMLDMESTANVLKSYQRGIGDVLLAVQFAAADAQKVLMANPVKDVTGIASVLLETVLDVQRLQGLVDHDHHRRLVLLESLQMHMRGASAAVVTSTKLDYGSAAAASNTADNSPVSDSLNSGCFFLQGDVLNHCIKAWEDGDGAAPAVFSVEDALLLEHIVQTNADRSMSAGGGASPDKS